MSPYTCHSSPQSKRKGEDSGKIAPDQKSLLVPRSAEPPLPRVK